MIYEKSMFFSFIIDSTTCFTSFILYGEHPSRSREMYSAFLSYAIKLCPSIIYDKGQSKAMHIFFSMVSVGLAVPFSIRHMYMFDVS